MHSIRLEKLLALYEENPTDSFINFALAKEYELNNNLNKAMQLLEKLIITNPNYLGTYLHLAKLYEKNGEIKKALNIYEKGLIVAKHAKDLHSLSELKNAKLNLEMDD